MIAVHCALDKTFTECGSCDCVNGIASYKKWEITGVLEPTAQCPQRIITMSSREWINLYSHYKNGLLFMPGGIAAQPHSYMEAMSIIEKTVNQDHAT